MLELKSRIHKEVLREIDQTRLAAMNKTQVRSVVDQVLREMVRQDESLPRLATMRDRLVDEVVDEITGYGPLEPLLADPTISEIMVNAPDKIFIERRGRIELSNRRFEDDAHILRIIERIVGPLGRRVDESSPMVDARLPDGSRVNAVVPPASPKGPIITIRKFFKERLGVTELVAMGSMTPTLAEFLRACVRLRLNIIISGGTGTGKTTLLNVLSSFIPETERIVTIEDTTELQLQQPHVVSLEARPPSLEGTNEITLRDLVKNSLRMRPDRIIVGEVRSGEAFDMLQAMNTGHEGSIGTVHANSPRDCMARLENMILMAGFELPIRAIREQIASAVHLVVQIARFRDGTRRITQVTEVQGMENQTITMQDIFVFEQRGVDEQGRIIGELVPTGLRPKFAERFEVEGIQVPPDLFVNPMSLMSGSIRWGSDR
jgi:pilus assembly protein CpaF